MKRMFRVSWFWAKEGKTGHILAGIETEGGRPSYKQLTEKRANAAKYLGLPDHTLQLRAVEDLSAVAEAR